MAKWFMMFLVVLSSGRAGARELVDATCLPKGCFVGGWSLLEVATGQTGLVRCLDDDCLYHGWRESDSRGRSAKVSECKSGGCFVKGWDTWTEDAWELVGRTTCLADRNVQPNCLSVGWISREPYSPQVVVRCLQDNCAVGGWQIIFRSGQTQNAVCKPGGCFEQGWVIHQE